MYEIIASTLFRNKICRLPGIGTLMMVQHPAETDPANARIRAPFESIGFIPETDHENIFNEFSAISELLQKNLDESGNFLLHGVGHFVKTGDGELQFTPVAIDPVLIPPIPAQIVSRQQVSHNMLVGDQETTNLQMADYFNEREDRKDRWWVWAVALGTISIGLLAFYCYKHGFNALGNISY